MSTHDILHRLSETLASRRHADPETSYTAKLFANGPDSILKKIGEESAELIMAAKDGKRPEHREGIDRPDLSRHGAAGVLRHGH